MLIRKIIAALVVLVFPMFGLTACSAEGVALLGNGFSNTQKKIISDVIKNDKTSTYKNPFVFENEWDDYGSGDPYVMKYDGYYYLYTSTKDLRTGIKCWRSEDMIKWKYLGSVCDDQSIVCAYAPEVNYWNGKFYLYTSPEGKGHFILESNSPTGPFKKMTPNLGLTIDGSVFVDDDEKMYFTHGNWTGILVHDMSNPLSIGAGKQTDAWLNAWSEGPSIFKRNGIYYMTYSGNHVFDSTYRVGYSVTTENPKEGWVTMPNSPIIVNTDDEFKGLGHNSTVIGPDLDSYYIVYHNLVGRSKEGPPVRHTNIDRLMFNGKKMSVSGPTYAFSQTNPALPRFSDRLDKKVDSNKWSTLTNSGYALVITKDKTRKIYNAEFNFRLAEKKDLGTNNTLGVVISYKDIENFTTVEFDSEKNSINAYKYTKGNKQPLAGENFSNRYDFTKLHNVRVEVNTGKASVFFDGMKKLSFNFKSEEGHIGYISKGVKGVYSFTAFSDYSGGNSDFEAYKAVPGHIEAVHYMQGENRGYSSKHNSPNPFRSEDKTNIIKQDDGTNALIMDQKGEWFNYKLNVKDDADYSLLMTLLSSESDGEISLYLDGEKLGAFPVKPVEVDDDPGYIKTHVTDLKLKRGFHILTMKLESGKVGLKYISFAGISTKGLPLSVDLDKGAVNDGIIKKLGNFIWMSMKDGYYVTPVKNSNKDNDAKALFGSQNWRNYRYEAEVKIMEDINSRDGGLIVRGNNVSSKEWSAETLMQGYFINLLSDSVELRKCNFDSNIVATADIALEKGKSYKVRVDAKENNIKVYINDMSTPLIDYYDSDAYYNGNCGFWSVYASSPIAYKSVKVEELK